MWRELLIGLCLAPLPAAGAGGGGAMPLPEPGAPVVRELAADAVHRYRLPPAGARGLWLAVDQEGIDLTLALVGTGGEPEVAVDSPTGMWGEEWLLVPAGAGGDRELEVRALAPGGAPGRYRLSVEAVPPESADLSPARAAERAATEAGRLNRVGTREAKTRALDLYGRALAAWREAGREAEAARTLLAVATLHRQLDRPREALPALEEALALWQSLGDTRSQAQALTEIASTSRALGHESEAVEGLLAHALEHWRAAGDLQGQAQTLNYLGLIRARSSPHEALERYAEALEVFRRLGDRAQEGVALNNMGGVHDLLGEPGPALDHYRRALEVQRRLGDRRQEAAIWNNVASVHRRTGRLQEALDGYETSLAIRRELGDRRGEGLVLNNLGLTRLALGEPERARDALEQALALRRASADRRGEAVTLHNLGLVHEELGDRERAVAYWTEVLALRRTLGDREGEAAVLVALGRTEGELGRPAPARAHLEEALALLGEGRNPWREAQARWTLGEVLTAAGEPEAAAGPLTRSLDLYRATGDELGESQALLALARAERAEPARAFGHAAAALDLLEEARTEVDAPGLRTSFFSRHDEAFELAVDLAMALHRDRPEGGWAATALETSERARARSLVELLELSGAGPRRGVDPALLERQRAALERLSAKVEARRRLLEAGGPSEASAALAREVREAEARLEAVAEEIRREDPAWDARARPRPLDASSVRALLDPGTTLLEYSLGEARSFLFAATSSGVEGHELPGREVIETAARELYEAIRINDPRSAALERRAAARLSAMLLAPVAESLAGRRLAIVADGALHYLPFAALPDPAAPGEPLLARHEIVILPSASALAVQRRLLAGRPPAARTLEVLADPVFGPSDPRLAAARGAAIPADPPGAAGARDSAAHADSAGDVDLDRLGWSRWEAEAIARHAPSGASRVALGFDADLTAVRAGGLRSYRILHFATHGVVDGEHPELSALVLSRYDRNGRPREGLLRLQEIYRLDLDAELVVLSGCRTALGQEVPGEGLIGLSRGFFAAGARGLVASLWQVQDRATAELMDRFYAHLLGDGGPLRPAAALRAAQLELMRRPGLSDPYFWAAFAAYGDWR
jgi:CHAT domain-containing protein/Tfp pilus assembly protein PilF